MYIHNFLRVLLFFLFLGITILFATAPKVDVVLEMKDGALLHVEYIAETDAKATVDIRAAILPDALCTGDALPKYLPKNAFRSPNKLESGQCSVTGKPFIVRSVTLEPAQILKRHDVTLLTLSKSGEKKQLPFLIEKNGYAWGYNFSNVEPSPVTPAPGLGLQAFPLDSTMETIQTVDVNGKREILLPSQNIFRKWLRLDPRVGLYYTPLLPTANINLLNFGPLGFTLENSIAIPEMSFLPLKKYSLRLRGGINVGYHTFAQELYQNNLAVADGHIMLLPVLLQATLYWDLKPKNMKLTVSPYLRLADGIVFSTVSTQLKPQYVSLLNPANANDVSRSGSYIGNGFGASLGVELKPESWPVAFAFDAGYFIHAQDITGSYFVFNAGAAWHYGTTKTTVKSLPIQYLGTKSVVLTLRGTTIEPDGKALPNSEIQIFAKGDDAPTKTVQTDAAAKYTVSIEPGLEYKIVVKHEGYAKTTTNLPLLSNDKKNNG